MIWKFNWRVGIALTLLAILMAFARVFVGAHYPLDVVGGAVLGGITSGLLYIFSGRAPLITVLDRAFAMFGRWRLATLEEKH